MVPILNLKPEGDELSADFVSKSILNMSNKFFASVAMKQSLKNLEFMNNLDDFATFQKYAKMYILAYGQVLAY